MLRIATWNVDHRTGFRNGRLATAEYLSETIRPDVALIQEAQYKHWAVDAEIAGLVMPHQEIDENRPWASAVVTYGPRITPVMSVRTGTTGRHQVDLLRTFPGSVAVAEVDVAEDEPIVVVSIYGLMDRGYSYTTLHKQFSDLTYLLDSPLRERVIVGGDLNAPAFGGKWRNLYHNLWERIELLGLVDLLHHTRHTRPATDCYCGRNDCGHVATLKNRSSVRPCDHLFASRALVEQLVACHVPAAGESNPDAWTLSKHRPVVAEFDL